ncbi:MAG: geranylgeranylglyceryl/heptaprenylglyceryl phosphate synthase [Candidatus Eisenbacteria sp.]|nr:geranylgeranylglyceryl/heptaprenylglyceryl phosphate synthase [Candidatus Eisenbacteria bacterium]
MKNPVGQGKPADSVCRYLDRVLAEKGAGYLVLLDPDRAATGDLVTLAKRSQDHGVDAILVGSSITLKPSFAECVAAVRESVSLPVIVFPGNAFHVVPGADAVFFLCLLSGRNPQFLVGEQAKAAPLIKAYELEAIPVGYLLIDSGERTSVEFMSSTLPIPRDKPDIAMAHALAAQYFGMRYVFMDGGSGGRSAVPVEMVRAVSQYIEIPLVVGGGIRSPEEAGAAVEAGASFVVTGNILEDDGRGELIEAFARAIHGAGASRTETASVEATAGRLRR